MSIYCTMSLDNAHVCEWEIARNIITLDPGLRCACPEGSLSSNAAREAPTEPTVDLVMRPQQLQLKKLDESFPIFASPG